MTVAGFAQQLGAGRTAVRRALDVKNPSTTFKTIQTGRVPVTKPATEEGQIPHTQLPVQASPPAPLQRLPSWCLIEAELCAGFARIGSR